MERQNTPSSPSPSVSASTSEANSRSIDHSLESGWLPRYCEEDFKDEDAEKLINAHEFGPVYQPREDELKTNNQKADGGDQEDVENGYLSIGDGGTSATIDGQGQFTQVSQYLGNIRSSKSSIFTIDPAGLEARSSKRRIWSLHDPSGAGLCGPYVGMYSFFARDVTISTSWIHYRWPRTVIDLGKSSAEKKVRIEFRSFVRNNVVILDATILNSMDEDVQIDYDNEFDALIREEDFVDRSSPFSSCSGVDAEDAGPGGYGMVRLRKFVENLYDDDSEGGGPEAVAAVTGTFINGKAVKGPEHSGKKTVKPKERFQITAGYKLVLVSTHPLHRCWKRLAITSEEVDIDRFLEEERIDASTLLHSNLEFYVGRNVQHILSVCSIPVLAKPAWDRTKMNDTSDQTVAITGGDVFGHRIIASASYFAFKFLLDVARSLGPDGCALKNRIRKTCEGHLRWVVHKADGWDNGKYPKCHWINGQGMCDSSGACPPTGLLNTPFQILKVYDFDQVFPGNNDLKKQALEMSWKWLKALDDENKREAYAWRHAKRGGMDYFRLDDHVWIWNAIAAISQLDEWELKVRKFTKDRKAKTTRNRKAESLNEVETKHYPLMRKYHPKNVRREIVQRFTTINEAAKQRMLAVTRSPHETRFEFHARDTALFYQLTEEKMLAGEDVQGVWRHTINVQHRFPSFATDDSDNLLRHGLRLQLAANGAFGSEDELNETQPLLRDRIPTNGLFSGGSNDDFDTFWATTDPFRLIHISFEIPYLLYSTYSPQKQASGQPMGEADPGRGSRAVDPAPKTDNPAFKTVVDKTSKTVDEDAANMNSPLNGTIPYNDLIDIKNITDVNEEWLYNYPDFFDREIPLKSLHRDELRELPVPAIDRVEAEDKSKDKPEEIKEESKKDVAGGPTKAPDEGVETLRNAVQTWLDQNPNDFYHPTKIWNDCRLVMVDAKKKRLHGNRSSSAKLASSRVSRYDTLDEIWNRLKEPRTVECAKKRFLWAMNPIDDYSLMCCLAVPDSERQYLCSFFDRHAHGIPHFEDKTSRTHNIWTTEFHGSCLQLIRENKEESLTWYGNNKSRKQEPRMFRRVYDGEDPHQLERRKIVWASAGFRIHGDFFDRYWTCHFVESYPGGTDASSQDVLTPAQLKRQFGSNGMQFWQQRKVLELLLFHWILEEINKNTDEITKNLRGKVRKISWTSSKRHPYSLRETWAHWHEILEYLGETLDDNLQQVKNWETRERDRRSEQPRWTNKDEKKYRNAIDDLLAVTRRDIRELRMHKITVDNLIKTLSFRRDEVKKMQSDRQNQDIQSFTYATVVFLPLTFATSIYSMQAAPSTDVLRYMVACAAVAFFVLILSIWFLRSYLHILLSQGSSANYRPGALWKQFKGWVEKCKGRDYRRGALLELLKRPRTPDEESGQVTHSTEEDKS